ncbi:MAG: hypothetical protein ACQESG_07875 [Nanobdellota archaeon]
MWSGGIIVVLVISLSALSGLYSDYLYCRNHQSELRQEVEDRPVSEETMSEGYVDYMKTMEIRRICSTVDSNIFNSHLVIIIGVALLVGGFVTHRLE